VTASAVTRTSGGSTCAEAKSQTEQLVRHAHVILSACGRVMAANRVRRIVRRYLDTVERNGWVFWDYFANAMLLSATERAQFVADPAVARVISYLDPTGEDAVNNVMRGSR